MDEVIIMENNVEYDDIARDPGNLTEGVDGIDTADTADTADASADRPGDAGDWSEPTAPRASDGTKADLEFLLEANFDLNT